MWNASGYRVAQTVEACSYRSWNAIATADNSSGDGAVKTYPNVHKDYDSRPALSTFPVLTATHAADAADTGIYNIGYDLWLNGVADAGSTEVMVWTDNQNQVPSGSRVAASVVLGGHTWDLYATSGNYRAFVATPELPSGTVDLRAMLNYLVARGLLAPNPTIGQVCFGVEVVSTNGTPATFNFTGFSLTDR
jgi:hypothetical protein